MGISLATLFPDATPSVILGALSGSAIYVLTSEPLSLWKQAIFATISFLAGLVAASSMTMLISGFVNELTRYLHPPIFVDIDPFFGSAAASALAITVLLHFIKKWRGKNDTN